MMHQNTPPDSTDVGKLGVKGLKKLQGIGGRLKLLTCEWIRLLPFLCLSLSMIL